MGKPKHRWTLEEENALRAGVDKYGTGKWRKILTDEDFAPCFIARTNVDLKDKWRNLCGNASSRVAFPRCSTYKETEFSAASSGFRLGLKVLGGQLIDLVRAAPHTQLMSSRSLPRSSRSQLRSSWRRLCVLG
ncbi:unnamed protein product [Lactuca saligna]|uniref:MYB transcription factor n=1 Tax=Lactuca saligna TaxID=75948 RepID=A0AA35V4L5_LACSI|nr:unnamed protein product [Lactuca saligna]